MVLDQAVRRDEAEAVSEASGRGGESSGRIDLCLIEKARLIEVNHEGTRLFKRVLAELEHHQGVCPFHVTTAFTWKSGQCWHQENCVHVRSLPKTSVVKLRQCSSCNGGLAPPDRQDAILGGPTLRHQIEEWLSWSESTESKKQM